MTKDTFPFILVDGSGYIFRAYYALPSLARSDGVSVGAVYGFTSMLLKLLETKGRDGLVVIFDAGRKTFRNALYPAYKANRPAPPEDLIPQFPLTRLACEALGVTWLESEGFEADDLIASYTKKALEVGRDVRIISSDKDLMQLIKPGVTFFDPMKQKVIDEAGVVEKFGVLPQQVCDVLALMGDSSDNIPGVPGIGPKGASQLIQRFGSLSAVLDHSEDIEKPSHRKAIQEFKEQALLSLSLVRLNEEAPLPKPIGELRTHPLNRQKCVGFLKDQGFSSLLTRVEKYCAHSLNFLEEESAPESSQPKSLVWDYRLISSKGDLEAIVKEASKTSCLSLVVEGPHNHPRISFCFNDHESYSVLISAQDTGDLFSSQSQGLTFPEALKILSPLIEDESIMKGTQDAKRLKVLLKTYHYDLVSFQDLFLMDYDGAWCRTGQTMSALADEFLELSYEDKRNLDDKFSSKGHTPEGVTVFSKDKKSALEAYIGFKLVKILHQKLVQEKALALYESMDKALITVLAAMEEKGILVSAQRLKLLSQEFGQRIQALEQQIYALAGESFTIGSPKQLAEILYNKMGLETGAKGKSGDYSTRADILESLAAQGHEFPKLILEWRGLSKLKSTYTDGLIDYISPKDGRIHTSFSLTTTSTGRLSSFSPNLQNIPIRTEEGLKIRQAFCADKNKILLSLDYSQIELRLLAHMSAIPALQEAFWNNQDIHAATAAQVFGCALDSVDKNLRRKAKIINFGIIYGISPFGLAQQLGISRTEAKEHIDAYFKTYPGIQDYMEAKKEEARQKGYVETLWGRRCRISDIRSSNALKRSFAERQAINAPLQGTSADIIKKAMIQCYDWEKGEKNSSDLLLQVHDELLFEVPENAFEDYASKLKNIMENVIQLSIPLVVDVSKGTTWGNLVPVKVLS